MFVCSGGHQVSHVGPDLQFATAEVTKSTAEGLASSSDGPSAASSAEEKQNAYASLRLEKPPATAGGFLATLIAGSCEV